MNKLVYIGTTFPDQWLWAKYEKNIINSLRSQIEQHCPNQSSLLINLTWFGPQFADNGQWRKYQQLVEENQRFDRLFLVATVDPAMIHPEQIQNIVTSLGNPILYKIGNFDTQYHFNFFAPVVAELFNHYDDQDILMQTPRWLYINYNRKPREHRVKFVKLLQQHSLDQLGLITLGRPNAIYDKDPTNTLFLTLGEHPEDYVKHGHWFNLSQGDEFGIPHDVLSLHNLEYWQHHFLHIIGATEFNHWDDIFVSETQFKPMIGLRPFLINGNARTYAWLRNNGFRTFDSWFPGLDFDNVDTVHDVLIQAVQQLSRLSTAEIVQMYNDMMPTLLHNRNRFYEYAREQRLLIDRILLQ